MSILRGEEMEQEDVKMLKNMYNFNLERYNKALTVFETATRENIDRWLPEFIQIQDTLSVLLEKILHYQNVTKKEVFEGFK